MRLFFRSVAVATAIFVMIAALTAVNPDSYVRSHASWAFILMIRARWSVLRVFASPASPEPALQFRDPVTGKKECALNLAIKTQIGESPVGLRCFDWPSRSTNEGAQPHKLRSTICESLLGPWRHGPSGFAR